MSFEFIYLTREGYEKLCHELEYLKGVRRKEISHDIEQARLHGDISENAEYDTAKEAQLQNEQKIVILEDKLSRARIIEDENISLNEVRIGATVRLKDIDLGNEFEYTIVSSEEVSYDEGKISVSSPVGRALLGFKEDDIVEIKAPARVLKYKIIGIKR